MPRCAAGHADPTRSRTAVNEKVIEGVNLRAPIKLHASPVDDIVAMLVIRRAVIIPCTDQIQPEVGLE